MWKLNNMFFKNMWFKEEITRGIRKYFRLMKTKTQHNKIYGMEQKQYSEGTV